MKEKEVSKQSWSVMKGAQSMLQTPGQVFVFFLAFSVSESRAGTVLVAATVDAAVMCVNNGRPR
jgi:hypothetical protein